MEEEYAQEIEIDLFEYLEIMWNNKLVIIGTMLVFVLGAAYASYFILKPVYQSKVEFPLPDIDEELVGYSSDSYSAFAMSDRILEELMAEHGRENMSLEEFRNKFSVEIEPDSRLLIFSLEAGGAERAKEIVVDWRELFYRRINERAEERIERDLERLERELASLETGFDEARGEIEMDGTDGLDRRLLQLSLSESLGNRQMDILEQREHLLYTRENLDEYIKSEAVRGPVLPESPQSPRPKLNIIIAAFLGLILSIFIIFIQQAWREQRVKD
ncbi:MAG: YveK family protein [Halanaerobiaceae bacterium]